MLEVVLTIPFWLELAAALTGGLSGAMSAVRARYDIFGVVCIALTAGLAGGIMRDLLMQNYGIYAFQKPELLLACAGAGVIVFYFGKLATYLDPVVALLDNLSVALWAVISVGKGLSAGLDVVPSIILGTVTAVGGGILRDVCMNREPETFQAGTLYGSAALVGSVAYALMAQNHILEQYAPWACAAIVLALRYASLLLGWRTKPPRDYTDVVTNAVARPVRSVARRVRPPKGKVERARERTAYERLRRVWRAPGSTSPLPPVAPRRPAAGDGRAAGGGMDGAAADGAPAAADAQDAGGAGDTASVSDEVGGVGAAGVRAGGTGAAAGPQVAGGAGPRAQGVADRVNVACGTGAAGAATPARDPADALRDPSDRIVIDREEMARVKGKQPPGKH